MFFEDSLAEKTFDPKDPRVRPSCDDDCTIVELMEVHSHQCDLVYMNKLLLKERDVVNYLALKLQSFTKHPAVEEILEAYNSV